MKFTKLAYTGSLLIVGLGLAVNGYSQSFLTNGLVAYYPFNGNANDASGNGINGTVYGATLTTNRFGTPNAAYYFGGAAYITAPLNITVFGGDFTVSVWYNAFDLANGWLSMLDAEDGVNYAFVLDIAGETSGANIGWLGAGSTYAPASGCWAVNSGRAVPVNTYSQVVITKAGTTVTMYLNGQVVSTGPVTHAIPTSGQFITIGRLDVAVYSEAWTFHGVLDDIRIYKRAFSTNEVQQLYAIESGPRVDLIKAVKPSFSNLTLTENYQLQVSGNMKTWTNQGSPFTATNTSMIYPQYFDVDNWNSLFFRVQSVP